MNQKILTGGPIRSGIWEYIPDESRMHLERLTGVQWVRLVKAYRAVRKDNRVWPGIGSAVVITHEPLVNFDHAWERRWFRAGALRYVPGMARRGGRWYSAVQVDPMADVVELLCIRFQDMTVVISWKRGEGAQ